MTAEAVAQGQSEDSCMLLLSHNKQPTACGGKRTMQPRSLQGPSNTNTAKVPGASATAAAADGSIAAHLEADSNASDNRLGIMNKG